MKTQRAEITLELEETVVVRQGSRIIIDFCPRCHRDVDMISPNVLALVAGASEREIFRMIEAGLIHFIEPGPVLACASCFGRAAKPSHVRVDHTCGKEKSR